MSRSLNLSHHPEWLALYPEARELVSEIEKLHEFKNRLLVRDPFTLEIKQQGDIELTRDQWNEFTNLQRGVYGSHHGASPSRWKKEAREIKRFLRQFSI